MVLAGVEPGRSGHLCERQAQKKVAGCELQALPIRMAPWKRAPHLGTKSGQTLCRDWSIVGRAEPLPTYLQSLGAMVARLQILWVSGHRLAPLQGL